MTFLAGVLGLLVPGTGQVINRKYYEGLIIFGSWLLWIFVSKYLFELDLILIGLGWFVFAGYSAFDSFLYNPKKAREEKKQLKEFDEMQQQEEKQKEIEKNLEEI